MTLKPDDKEIIQTAIQEAVKAGGYSDKAVMERLKKNVRWMDNLSLNDVVILRKQLGIKLPRGRAKGKQGVRLVKRKQETEDRTPGDNHPVTLTQLRDAIEAAAAQATAAGELLEQYTAQEKERVGL